MANNLETGGLVDAGASAIAENLSQWKPRKGDCGWPPAPEVIAGSVSRWRALLLAVYRMSQLGLDVESATALEVGCGFGDGMRPLLFAGFRPGNLNGIDLMPARLAIAQRRLPGMNFVHGNAAEMQEAFAAGTFDVVCEQYCFCHIPQDETKQHIAAEMLRVAKPGGFILIHDWRLTAKGRHIFGPSRATINSLFRVGLATERIAVYPSLLWPPVGNLVSRLAMPMYGLLAALPPLVGSRITLLRKLRER